MLKYMVTAALMATALVLNIAGAQTKGVDTATKLDTCTSRFADCNQYCGTNATNPLACGKTCKSRLNYCLPTGTWQSSSGNVQVDPK